MTPIIYAGLEIQPQLKYRTHKSLHRNDQQLADTVAALFYAMGIDPAEAKSKSRIRQLVEARQIAMYLIRKHLRCTYKFIGEYFGGRDHTTVIYSLSNTQDLIDTDSRIRQKVADLESEIFTKTARAN